MRLTHTAFSGFSTLPNLISVTRIALAPTVCWAVFADYNVLAAILFGLAVVSDILDGFIARRWGYVSRIGALTDHSADAIFVSSVSAVYAYLDKLPVLLPFIIAIAFVQYVSDSRASGSGVLRPSRLGRWNGIAYFIVVGCAIFVGVFEAGPAYELAVEVFAWCLIASTALSIFDRATYRMRGPG